MAYLLDINGEDPGLEGGGTPWEFDSIDDDGGTNPFSLQAAAAIHGSYGYRSLFTGSGDSRGIVGFAETADIYFRLYFEVDTYAGSEDNYFDGITLWDGSNATASLRLYRTATTNNFGYRLYINNGGVTLIDKANDNKFVIGTSYCVEIHYLSDESVGGAEIFINDVSDGSDFEQNTSAYVTDGMSVGPYAGVLANGDTFYWDDIIVSATKIGLYAEGGSSAVPIIQQMRRRRS